MSWNQPQTTKKKWLPGFFKPLLWSYNFSSLDLEKDKKVIIINAINYGDLNHWRWLVQYYGEKTVREVVRQAPATAMRMRARNLAALIFSIKKFNYAPRGAHQRK